MSVLEIKEHAAAVAEAIYEDGYDAGAEAGYIEGYSAGVRVALDTAALTESGTGIPVDVSLETLVGILNKWAPNVDAFQQALAEAVEELEDALEEVSDFSDADALLVENLQLQVAELTARTEFLEEAAGYTFTAREVEGVPSFF